LLRISADGVLSAEFCVRGVTKVPRKKKTGKYKLKTHKATAKRFRLTGSGKLVRTKGGKSHRRRVTSKRTKRLFTEMIPVRGRGIKKRVQRLAPNLKKAS
jgi:large subunit ribosomal protein L35